MVDQIFFLFFSFFQMDVRIKSRHSMMHSSFMYFDESTNSHNFFRPSFNLSAITFWQVFQFENQLTEIGSVGEFETSKFFFVS